MKSDQILEKIRKKLEESEPTKRTLTDIFLFHFQNCDGKFIKDVVLDLKNLKIFDGTIANPNVEISVTDEDFYLVGTKQISFDELIKSGKVQVKGQEESLNKMIEKFRLNSQ